MSSHINSPVTLVSILIVNYHGAGLLRDCLDSVKLIDYQNYEVIVVDNASKDNSLEILKEYPWVKVVVSDRNLGFTGGNNLGLVHSKGEYILLLNNDTIVNPTFVGELSRYLDSHSNVGIVQGKMLLPRHNQTLDECGSFITPIGFNYHYGFLKPDGAKYQHSHPVFTGKGACMMFRKNLLEKVGGYLFNEDLFCYYEETDFCHRAWMAGYETHFVPTQPIQHLMGATSDLLKLGNSWFHLFLRNQTFCLLSNLSAASIFKIMPLYFLFFGMSMMGGLLLGRFSSFRAHFRALWYCITNFDKIISQRKKNASIRRIPDKVIWKKTMYTPRLEYFWKAFTGQISSYIDEDLPSHLLGK